MTDTDNKLFEEIKQHLLEDDKPSEYFKKLLNENKLKKYPFNIIGDMEKVMQNPKHHPEGTVFAHTMMVIDKGAELRSGISDKESYMLALLLHDSGKKEATKMLNGRLTSYDHDKIGKKTSAEFLNYFDFPNEKVKKISSLVRWHMQSIFAQKKKNLLDINGMMKEVKIKEIVPVFLADRLGRGNINLEKEKEIKEQIYELKKYLEKTCDSKQKGNL